eukprot:scaffold374749_cov32-Prasinocladus_malaysianus.AAC.1
MKSRLRSPQCGKFAASSHDEIRIKAKQGVLNGRKLRAEGEDLIEERIQCRETVTPARTLGPWCDLSR